MAEARSGSGLPGKRLKGFEPSTFCMASRRSSQLSYSRARAQYSRGLDVIDRVEHELEPGQAAAGAGGLAAPAVGEAVDEQQSVAAALVDAAARLGAWRADPFFRLRPTFRTRSATGSRCCSASS